MSDDTWIRELVQTEPEYTVDEILSMDEMPGGMVDRLNKSQKRSRINLMPVSFAFAGIKYAAQMRKVLGGLYPDATFQIFASISSKMLNHWKIKSSESLTVIHIKEKIDGNFTIDFNRKPYRKKHSWEGFRLEGLSAGTVLEGLLYRYSSRKEHIPLDRNVITSEKGWNGVIKRCGCCAETHVPMKKCSKCNKTSCSIHYHVYESANLYSYRNTKSEYFICDNCLSGNPIEIERHIRFGPGGTLIKESEAPQWLLERLK